MKPQANLASNNISDPQLHEIYTRLGDALLVPFGDDGKPLTNTKSFAETQTSDYLRLLARSKIAVRLGPLSGDLYAVSFNTVEAAEEFINNNPIAASTVSLNYLGYTSYFFRLEGIAPRAIGWGSGEWLGADRYVFMRVENVPKIEGAWMAGSEPVRIEFEQLVWRGESRDFLIPAIAEACYDEPFLPGRKGRRDLNFVFFASWFARTYRIEFSEELEEFCYYDPDIATWKELTDSFLDAWVLEFLAWVSRLPGFKLLRCRMGIRDRKKIIIELKAVAWGSVPGLTNGIKQFVQERIEVSAGCNVTIEELHRAYVEFCHINRFSKCRERKFQTKITELMESLLGATRSHSIQREGGQLRGFRNLRLKLEPLKAAMGG